MTRMRFRTDGWHYADLKANGWVFDGEGEKSYSSCFDDPAEKEELRREWDTVPPAERGDVWQVRWRGEGDGSVPGPIAGYAFCCPGCGHVHTATSSGNCGQKIQRSYKDKDGKDVPYTTCAHSGVGSCWSWSGSAEGNTLTCSPSILVTMDKHEPGGCNWHGFLTNGVFTP